MPTSEAAAHLDPISEYAALLAQSRIEALRALSSILATSEDPTEKRLAAVAILRAPDPESPAVLVRSVPETPVRTYAEQIAEEKALQASARARTPSTHQISPEELADSLITAKRMLTAAGIPLDDPLEGADFLEELDKLIPPVGPRSKPVSPAAHLASAAGQAPPS
jgi:hypothetical protein